MHTRRYFLSMAALAAASAKADTPRVEIRVNPAVLAVMPLAFNGLSYESTQLYNPDFFSAANTALVAAFRGLSKQGVLRLGGSLSNSSRWKSEAGTFETPAQTALIESGRTQQWEWKLCDPYVREHRDGAITPLALARLRRFCDATGWRVIYGLDCSAGSAERARDEACHVAAALEDKLMAFQVGNEADFFRKYRAADDAPAEFRRYHEDYLKFVTAVRQAVPEAPFGGPDTAVNMDWVESYAKSAGPDAVLLSSHFYAMGPGTDPSQNAELLLSGKSRLGALIAQAQRATKIAGVPFRLTETNSCFRGGRPGVSDAFASALWCADMMLHTASAGFAGVNLHGGGDGIYTPIETAADGSTILRPLYFGMRFAEYFAGAQILGCEHNHPRNLSAYAAAKGKTRMMAVINKSASPVTISQSFLQPAHIVRLQGPSLDAKTGTALHQERFPKGLVSLPAYSAALLTS